ncbi:hypothetical protein PRIPAC_80133 [Pristionchus pacificus]|nr:hypothetical protein PRIPAC_80133 [Pristionchus pacificus]
MRLLPPLYKYSELEKYAGQNIDNFEYEVYGFERLDEIDVSLFREQILPDIQEYMSKASTNTGKQRWNKLVKQTEYSKENENTMQFFAGKEQPTLVSPSCTNRIEAEVKSLNNSEQAVQRKSTKKPKLTFTSLIALALLNSETGRLPVQDIYAFITKEFPYFLTAEGGWRNSVRHSLSKSNMFTKVLIPSMDFTRDVSLWSILPEKKEKIKSDLAAQAERNKIDDDLQRHHIENPSKYHVEQKIQKPLTKFKAVKLQDAEKLAAVNAIENNNFMESLAEHNSSVAGRRRNGSFPLTFNNSLNISPTNVEELGSFLTKRPAILSRSTAKRPISSVSGYRITSDSQFAKKQCYESRPIDPSSISLF